MMRSESTSAFGQPSETKLIVGDDAGIGGK
jgi:hypothetical protein